jgi:hypothetical protein
MDLSKSQVNGIFLKKKYTKGAGFKFLGVYFPEGEQSKKESVDNKLWDKQTETRVDGGSRVTIIHSNILPVNEPNEDAMTIVHMENGRVMVGVFDGM